MRYAAARKVAWRYVDRACWASIITVLFSVFLPKWAVVFPLGFFIYYAIGYILAEISAVRMMVLDTRDGVGYGGVTRNDEPKGTV